jgi:DNA-binding NtrC family response regulator
VLTAENGERGLFYFEKDPVDLVLLDIRLPDMNGIDILKRIKAINDDAIVIMMTGYGTIENAVLAIKHGASDYVNKPFKANNILTIIKLALETKKLKREVEEFKSREKSQKENVRIIGQSKEIRKTIELIKKVSEIDSSTVLVQGESGTGKELVAKSIHYNRKRFEGPFVEINCSSIPYNLLESELFGYEQGAFTDAKKMKRGLIEQANDGTLFLDEIGDMDIAMQSKILNVLQERKFRRLGGHQAIPVSARIIAATNHNLLEDIRHNKFREDLYYRINVINISVPPLRSRKEDVIDIARHFIDEFNFSYRRNVRDIDKEASRIMMNYSWPGNVRELRNTIERIVIIDNPDVIMSRHLPREMQITEMITEMDEVGNIELNVPDEGLDLKKFTVAVQNQIIKMALKKAGGSKSKAAKYLNIDRYSLRYLMNKNNPS